MLFSVLPVLRNLPTDHPRVPLLPGFKRSPFAVWPLLFLLILVGFGALVAWQTVGDEAATPTRSVVRGRVTQVEPIESNSAQQIFLKYRFMAGDKLFNGNEISQYYAAAPQLGDEIRVSYNSSNPQDNYRALPDSQIISAEKTERIAFIVVPILSFLWLTAMFFFFAPVSPRDWLVWRRARGLYRNGEITAGRVQFVRPTTTLRSVNKVADYEIVATYKVEGVRLLAITRCNNAWLVGQLAPEIEVVVAYDPLKPERAVILEPFAF